jgi:prophage regulatory protein
MPALSGLSSRQTQLAGGRAAMREPDRIIRLKTVLARTGLSRSTIYRKIAEGTFPAQLKISTNGTGWHESEIDRWIADPVGWRPKGEFDEVRDMRTTIRALITANNYLESEVSELMKAVSNDRRIRRQYSCR